MKMLLLCHMAFLAGVAVGRFRDFGHGLARYKSVYPSVNQRVWVRATIRVLSKFASDHSDDLPPRYGEYGYT
jgi:hypothetical protein